MDSSSMRVFKIGLIDAISKYRAAVKSERGVDQAFDHTLDVVAAFRADTVEEWEIATQFTIDKVDYIPDDVIKKAFKDVKPKDIKESIGVVDYRDFINRYTK